MSALGREKLPRVMDSREALVGRSLSERALQLKNRLRPLQGLCMDFAVSC